MKIELKELAGYLPYGLKIIEVADHLPTLLIGIGKDRTGEIFCEVEDFRYPESIYLNIKDIKPILHPLSDLTKEREHNGERFIPILRIFGGDDYEKYNCKIDIVDRPILGKRIDISIEGLEGPCISFSLKNILRNGLTYESWQQLHEWHFDLYNWIGKGLAIDINTLDHA